MQSLLEKVKPQAEAVTLPTNTPAGRLRWLVAAGQDVAATQLVARVGEGMIHAPYAGRVLSLGFPNETLVKAGDVLLYMVKPPQARQSGGERANGRTPAPTRPAPTAPPTRAQAAPKPATDRPQVAPDPAPAPPARRGHVAPPLNVEELPTLALAKKPAKRESTKHRGYYVLPSQERALKRLAADLSLDDDNPLPVNESELIRAAIELLRSLPAGALRAVVEQNKEREQAGQYGSGFPRPGAH